MEKYIVPVPKKEYLESLKEKMDSPFYFTQERVNGIFLGPFFAITHHAEWEWNRKITGECNRAYGLVRETDRQTEVCFIRSKGLLSPLWLAVFTLFVMFLFSWNGLEAVGLGIGQAWLISFAVAFVPCGISAVEDSLTDNGITGAREITRLLKDPIEYF